MIKFQIPSTKSHTIDNLNLNSWNLLGIWELLFGIYAIVSLKAL